jgi:uncharacterized membrane protein YoaK (UPF0700 family)
LPDVTEQREFERKALALLLAWIAGGVDAIGYLTLLRLFTAHQSGNSVAMGAYFGQRNWGEALHRAFPIPLFVLGVMLGATLSDAAIRRRARSVFLAALSLELLLLVIYMLCGGAMMRDGEIQRHSFVGYYALVALLPLAMGLQSTMLLRLGGRVKVRMVFVTGILTDFAEEIIASVFALRDEWKRRSLTHNQTLWRAVWRQESMRRAMLYGAIWLAYVCGAIICGFGEAHWKLWALLFPITGLCFVIAHHLLRPLEAVEGSVARR